MDEFIGIIKLFAGNFAPRGWALCNGQLLSIAQNTALFSILGTTYGGDGRTTFGLPDLRSRVPAGAAVGTAPIGLTAIQLGEVGGAEKHTLLTNEMPMHTHTMIVSDANADTAKPVSGNTAAAPGAMAGRDFTATLGFNSAVPNVTLNAQSIGTAGNNAPHSIMQPYLGLSYIICMEGVYPPRN